MDDLSFSSVKQTPSSNQPQQDTPTEADGANSARQIAGDTVVVPPPPKVENVGDRIGRYKLLQPIGEGGCGLVYLAEQEEPVRRRVALKVIKLGMDTKSVIARFDAERQALALMDHPNIAKVLDAGATEQGRPFFVMELVRGVKLTEYCDQNKLSTVERLKLFVQVCQAIQHAHQKGIIHRDIKPSNILVTLHDDTPIPKVIDFGIAKATQGRLTDQTLFTACEQFIGTPAYMSPEQAELTGLDVDTRSDIYALGVLLYELLTGRTPFDTKELMASGLDRLRRVIREKEPERPSTRLRTMVSSDLTTTAHARHTDPPKLIHLVRGDLDWIVMKALEKDRTRRYETANGLAMDVQRYLNNEPVLARPPSNLYRFQKMVRRNRMALVAAGAVALALLAGLGVSLYLLAQEKEALQRAVAAEREQARLRQQAETALQLQAQLRQEKEYSDKLDGASRALSENRFDDAQQLLLEVPRHAASASLFNALGIAFARRGEWSRALTNFETITEIAPSEQLPYVYVSALLAREGEQAAYKRNCERIINEFGNTHAPAVAERMAKACLIAPGPEIAPVLKLINVAAPLGGNRQLSDDFKLVEALAEFRQEHFAATISWLNKINLSGGTSWRTVQVDVILAMVQWRQGREEQARATLAEGVHLAETGAPKVKVRDLGPAWIDAAISQALIHEAKGLVESPSKPSVPEKSQRG